MEGQAGNARLARRCFRPALSGAGDDPIRRECFEGFTFNRKGDRYPTREAVNTGPPPSAACENLAGTMVR